MIKILYTCVRNCKTYLSNFTVYEVFFEFIEIVTKIYHDNLYYNYFIIYYGNRNYNQSDFLNVLCMTQLLY